jgi:hypothetical protein
MASSRRSFKGFSKSMASFFISFWRSFSILVDRGFLAIKIIYRAFFLCANEKKTCKYHDICISVLDVLNRPPTPRQWKLNIANMRLKTPVIATLQAVCGLEAIFRRYYFATVR